MSGDASAKASSGRPAAKRFAEGLKRLLVGCVRVLLVPLCEPLAVILSVVPGNAAYAVFRRHGFHLLRKHYYLPIPDEEEVNAEFLRGQSGLVGIEIDERHVLHLMEAVLPPYVEEFRQAFPLHEASERTGFFLINGSYMAIDAHVYYAFIRHFKPKQVLEVGAGSSTLLAAAACRRNLREHGQATKLTAVEPFPDSVIRQGVEGLSQLIVDKLQNVSLQLFAGLEAGDILFLDSSHVLRAGGDVQREYCEILPRLAPGVFVHIHDISLPKPYPRVYFDNQLYWNEQYLLQVMLSFTSRYEVVWPGNYMMLKYPERVAAAFPEYYDMRKYYPLAEPSSFWMRVK